MYLFSYSALLRGSSRIYSVDQVPDRLALAESIGAVPIQFNASDPVQQILAQEPNGVTRALDCVGFESVNATGQRADGLVPRNLLSAVAQQGGIAIAGVYTGVPISIFEFWRKTVIVGSEIVLPLEHAHLLVDLVANDRAFPGLVVSSIIDI
ncbi:alcohol dehydrogenase [Penicillium freii]|nr:alcohol dehydrogenase [Penicillium freii]